MKNVINLEDIKDSLRVKSAIVALIVTFFTFLAFVGQWLYSDVVTFAKSGDQMQLCYASFLKLGKYLKDGILWGVDTTSSNGATEFFLRGQLPVRYFPMMLFSLLGTVFNPRMVYMSFYAVHLFVALYYMQRIGQKHFKMDFKVSVLLAMSCMPVLCQTMWYSSHAIITFLVAPLLYYALESIESPIKNVFFMACPWVLAFTAGYITLSVALVGIVLITAWVYGYCFKQNNKFQKIFINTLLPVVIAGIFVFLYYLGVLLYIKYTVCAGSYVMADALAMDFHPENIMKILFSSYIPVDGIESMRNLIIGPVWGFVIMLLLCSKARLQLDRGERIFISYCVLISVILLIVAMGNNTPFGGWFYSLFPILGQTHLPIRYMMITMPLLFIVLCMLFDKIEDGAGERKYWKLYIAFFIVSLALCVFDINKILEHFYIEKLILEVLVLATVLYLVYHNGWKSTRVIGVWCTYMICLGVQLLYAQEQVNYYAVTVNTSTIMYDDNNRSKLNQYFNSLEPEKEILKFIHLDPTSFVTTYIPGNVAWYDITERNIGNYIGMDIHTCLPEDYRSHFSWFDVVDWKYLYNTRADVVIAEDAAIQNEINEIGNGIVWENSGLYLNNKFRVCELKKYIPTYYTEERLYVEDIIDNPLDNGYFYCPYLTNEDIVSFSTDDATYFNIELKSTEKNDIAFLLYPNKHYKYYVDGVEVSPIIYEMQSYVEIEEGSHLIQIKYDNKMDQIAAIIHIGYYGLFFVCGLGMILLKATKRIKKV